jgi:lysophospholipase
MDPSPNGLVPTPDFLHTHLRTRPSFNHPSSTPLPELESRNEKGEPRKTPSLRTLPSKHGRHVLYTVHELHPLLDSSSISAPGWTQIARVLQHNYNDYDGFVVLHGTDSLAYTASALAFMLLNLQKPVILTGSQVPMSALHSDATDNLVGALAIAGQFLIPEVGLFFNQRLFRGCRCTKVSADAFSAFDSPNMGPLAEVKAMGILVYWDRVLPRGSPRVYEGMKLSPLRIRAHLGTSFVASFRVFPGLKAEMLDAVIRVKSLKGLVLETFGAGNAPLGTEGQGGDDEDSQDKSIMQVLREASERQVVVVGVSQCKLRLISHGARAN